jgi:cytochrome c556
MKTRILFALALVACAAAAQAQQPKPEDQLKLRKAAYSLMGYSFARLGAMAEGKRPYSKEDAVRYADLLAQVATVPKAMFGEGTDKVGETRAKPEIWTHRADFDTKMNKMVDEVARLQQVANGGDEAAFKKAVKETDDACTACHDEYRVKRR